MDSGVSSGRAGGGPGRTALTPGLPHRPPARRASALEPRVAAALGVAVTIAAAPRVSQSSPPVPLSVPERGDSVRSPSPEGRGGQGVRTGTGSGGEDTAVVRAL